MLFNSYIFIFAFLPVTVTGYYILNHFKKFRIANAFLILMSLWFYGYFNYMYLFVIGGSILTNWIISQIINRQHSEAITKRKMITALGCCFNLGLIFYFKYYDFFLSNINSIFGQSFELRHILLPLGISFFTFQQISFIIDTYKGETKEYHFLDYALFVSFFPQLIAGPIVLHREVIPQFRDIATRKFHYENFSRGLYIFAIGLFKKVILADSFGLIVSYGYSNITSLTSLEAIIISLAYTFQLYFDFSGYCDMAVGLGNMFNIKIIQNFNSPYKAISIIDFWSRWHISLTRFFRQYLYYPLGGNRKGKVRTYINIMIVFLLSGLWHGANWTFIIWGGIHGIANCINHAMRKRKEQTRASICNKVVKWLSTFTFINLTWVIFRSDSVTQAFRIFKKIFSFDSFRISENFAFSFNITEAKLLRIVINKVTDAPLPAITAVLMGLFILIAFWIVLTRKNSSEIVFIPRIRTSLSTSFLIVWSVLSFTGMSQFLYFNF